MQHREYVRINPQAETAVLFIHGIVGAPNHFRDLIPLVDLVPAEYSVYNILLDGHGGTVEDFAETSMKKWHDQVWRTFHELAAAHKNVILVAHSMGTLFALLLAVSFPQKVSKLFLLAIPMRPWVRLHMMLDSVALVLGWLNTDCPQKAAVAKAVGVQTTKKLWKYVTWIPRFLELFREIHRAEKVLPELTVPCTVYQSERDELVSNRSLKILKNSGTMTIHTLPRSSHFYYDPADRIKVLHDFEIQMKETHG